jgi:lipopolysaccharide transport system permease protein
LIGQQAASAVAPTVIRSGGSSIRGVRLDELWAFRELLYFFVWRDAKVRYKQTVLGAAWALLQPVMTMVVFTIFLGRLGGMRSDGVPYPLFSFAALVPWTYFATAVGNGSVSLAGSQSLISKVYFPRVLVPLAATLTPLVDFAISLTLLAVMFAWYGVVLTPAVFLAPVFALLAVATALAATLWLSALNAQYRDVRYVLPFLIQFWLFATPVAYPASLVPARWRPLYGLNPMVGAIEGFRWSLLGTPAPGAFLAVSIVVVIVALVFGLRYFRRVEGRMVDFL